MRLGHEPRGMTYMSVPARRAAESEGGWVRAVPCHGRANKSPIADTCRISPAWLKIQSTRAGRLVAGLSSQCLEDTKSRGFPVRVAPAWWTWRIRHHVHGYAVEVARADLDKLPRASFNVRLTGSRATKSLQAHGGRRAVLSREVVKAELQTDE